MMAGQDRPHEHEHESEAELLCELAWGLIANAYEGNWERAPREWRGAAERWRDRWHRLLFVEPPFRVEPRLVANKSITIVGPGDLTISVDYDDVNHRQVNDDTEKLVMLLNANWGQR